MHKAWYFFLCITVFVPIFFTESGLAQAPLVVSLGAQCTPASAIKFHNLSHERFPFDWLVTPFESLCKILEDDFENFFLYENLELWANDKRFVLDKGTGCLFAHDFPMKFNIPHVFDIEQFHQNSPAPQEEVVENFLDYYKDICAIYQRRIKRFKELAYREEPLIFFRRDATAKEATILHELLAKKFPNRQFMLVIIDYRAEAQMQWNLTGIKNYYIHPSLIWKVDTPEWINILKELALLPIPLEVP
jgi:hypothetical protein